MGWVQERNEGQPEETPKQKLLNWIRSKLPSGMPLTNFTSDWNDGVAVGALVNALVPGAVMDWDQWTPENALENTQKAMQIAQERLGVEPVSFSLQIYIFRNVRMSSLSFPLLVQETWFLCIPFSNVKDYLIYIMVAFRLFNEF
ncbi:hypothetical protein ANCCAN_12388 [Ancylostoma caninum]|uniref:Calponin-homology (CH) domain-containing protein n=1 Tax=Ancylostoma caninum TaxID=29170 RepID=A0A368GEF5_ANCCA|nr:hypothetical protein ANCCAN_12388 [Ancylostoma caninum]